MMDRVFLSSTLKFNEMTSDSESDIITLKSTRMKDNADGDSVFTIAVFSSPPLKFVAMFEVKIYIVLFFKNFIKSACLKQIKSSIFGKKIQDAGVSQGLIFIRYFDDKVALFSLDTILQQVNI